MRAQNELSAGLRDRYETFAPTGKQLFYIAEFEESLRRRRPNCVARILPILRFDPITRPTHGGGWTMSMFRGS